MVQEPFWETAYNRLSGSKIRVELTENGLALSSHYLRFEMRSRSLRDAEPGRAAHTRPCSCPNARPACMCRLPTPYALLPCLVGPPVPTLPTVTARRKPAAAHRRTTWPHFTHTSLHCSPEAAFAYPNPPAPHALPSHHVCTSTHPSHSAHVNPCTSAWIWPTHCAFQHTLLRYIRSMHIDRPSAPMPQHRGANFFFPMKDPHPKLRTTHGTRLIQDS